MSNYLPYGMTSTFIVAQLKPLLDSVQGAHDEIVAKGCRGTRDRRAQWSKIVGFGRHRRGMTGMLPLLEDCLDGFVRRKVQRVCGYAPVDDRLNAPPKTSEALPCICRRGALRHGHLTGEAGCHRFDTTRRRPSTGSHTHMRQTRLCAGWQVGISSRMSMRNQVAHRREHPMLDRSDGVARAGHVLRGLHPRFGQ